MHGPNRKAAYTGLRVLVMQEQIFQGTYLLCGEIGRGGMSTVYLAEHLRLKTKWAIKQVGKYAIPDFNVRAEAELLKKLHHPMLPRIIDIFEDSDNIYIVEDYIPGMSMDRYLEAYGPVPEAQALEWFKAICEALHYLHSQSSPVIYRDMKPSNIIVQMDGALKLIDFGIAREYKAGSVADTSRIGTKGYAAPEQFGNMQSDARTDIYSLGVTIYHMLTGKSPYEPPYSFLPVRQFDPRLSPGLEHIVKRCLQPNPADRYQSVQQLYDDLNGIYRCELAYKVHKRKTAAKASLLAAMLALSLFMIYKGYTTLTTQKTGNYNQLISQADKIAASDMSTALSLLDRAQALYPQELAAYEQQAYLLLKYDEAASCIEYVTEQFANNPVTEESGNLNSILASAYFSEGDYASAAYYFKRGAQYLDYDPDRMRDYAVSVGRTGDVAAAKQILSQMEGAGSAPDVTAYVNGELDYASGDYTKAEQAFLSCLSSTENRDLKLRLYTSLAQLYKDVAQSSSGTISDPLGKEINIINMGITELSLQSNAVFYEMLGEAYFNRGLESGSTADYSASADAFAHVLELGMTKDNIFINLFSASQMYGDFDRAMDALSQMKSAFPNDANPYIYSALLLIKIQNDRPPALRDYTDAYNEYRKAASKLGTDSDTVQFQQLESLIDQLSTNGWLEGVS